MHGYIILLTCTVSWLCLQRCCYNLKYLSIYDDSTCVLLEFTKFYYWVIIKPCSNITPCWICSFNFYRRILKFHSCLLKYSIITQQAWFNLYHLTYTPWALIFKDNWVFQLLYQKLYIASFILWFNTEYKLQSKMHKKITLYMYLSFIALYIFSIWYTKKCIIHRFILLTCELLKVYSGSYD